MRSSKPAAIRLLFFWLILTFAGAAYGFGELKKIPEGVIAAPATIPVSAPPAAADKATLNAIMKHPREPNFDRLRPMSGTWIRCKNLPGPSSEQDRFSSSDSKHFSRVTALYSDRECKNLLSESRTSWECEAASKDLLNCRLVSEETGSAGKWNPVKKSERELAASAITLSLRSVGKKAGHRQLEVRIRSGAGEETFEAETLLLNPPADKSPAPTTELPGSPAKTKLPR